MKAEYNPLLSYPKSRNRLMILDWASMAYHQWHSIISKNNPKFYQMDTPAKEIEAWKTSMVAKLLKIIRLFNPIDVIICLEGTGTIWRKTAYADYYKKHTRIFYDATGYYIKFDNFLYKVSKQGNGFNCEKLDPTISVSHLKKIDIDKLSPVARSIIGELIPSYKGNRKKNPWKHLTPKAEWTRIRDDFAREFGDIIRANVVHDPEAEGDDIMYVSVINNETKYDDMILVTGDSDALQLLTVPNLVIYNHKKDNIDTCINPRRYIDIKILSGDKSDNINGMALPGKKVQLGESTAETLYESVNGNCLPKAEVEGWVDQYQRNRKLIDMSFIPHELEIRLRNLVDTPRINDVAIFEKIYQLGVSSKISDEISSMKQIGFYVLNDYSDVINNPNILKESNIFTSKQQASFDENPQWGVTGFF